MKLAIAVLLAVLTSPAPTDSARLLLIPANVRSHVLFFARLGEQLAGVGHRTHLLVPSNADTPLVYENLTVDSFPVENDEAFSNRPEMSEVSIELALSRRSEVIKLPKLRSLIRKMLDEISSDCTALLENVELVKTISAAHYDFAVVDPMSIRCYLLPYSLGIPYASFSINIFQLLYRVPSLPSMVPAYMLNDNAMTFADRLISFVHEFALLTFVPPISAECVQKYAPDKPLIDERELYRNSALWLYLDDIAVGHPRPTMPNTVAIGDIMARPGNLLPPNLQTFLDEARDGAVVVSFGSFFDFIPENIARKFCSAFRSIGKLRVVWKSKVPDFCQKTENIEILSWIPQNDILAHPNTKVFITHGGVNSLIESVYHAKPVIVFPISNDQPNNAANAASKGYGIKMDLSSFTSDELAENINRTIASGSSFQVKAVLFSAILRDKPEKPAERVSFLIEHVIKHGDQHLRTGAYSLSLFQFIMFDIFAFITAAVVFLLVAVAMISIYVNKTCCRFCRRLRKHKQV